jgi:nitric oxide reductase large subunit
MQETIDQENLSNNQFYQQRTLPNSTATLVLGIISIVGCIFYGVPGIVCGIIAIALHNKDKKIYVTNPNLYAQSYKNLRAGFVCAIVGLSLSILYFLIIFLAFFFAFSFGRFR